MVIFSYLKRCTISLLVLTNFQLLYLFLTGQPTSSCQLSLCQLSSFPCDALGQLRRPRASQVLFIKWSHVLWCLQGFVMWLCWSVILHEQNSRPGQTMTSHRQRPSQTSHNKQLSVATLRLWSEEAEMRSVFAILSSLLPFSLFLYDISLYLSIPSRWAGVLNEVTIPAALGRTSKCHLWRGLFSPSLLSFIPSIGPSPLLSLFLSFYPSPSPLLLLVCSLIHTWMWNWEAHASHLFKCIYTFLSISFCASLSAYCLFSYMSNYAVSLM